MERDREDRSVLASWQGPETSGMSSLYMLIFMGALGVFFAVGIVVFLLVMLVAVYFHSPLIVQQCFLPSLPLKLL